MTNELTIESARNLTDAQLLSALASGLNAAADGIMRASIAVVVATERGITLPKLPEVFRYAPEIASGALSARAAMTLAAYPFTVRAVLSMSHEMQEQLADGMKVKIAVRINGRIQSAERTIWEMSQMQMRVAFTEGNITPWEEQGEWLLKSGHVEGSHAPTVPVPRFDKKSGKIVIGRRRLNIEDFRQAFLEAGYLISPAYAGKRKRTADA